MIGKTLGTYQILAELGRGGMGEVYRAHDTKLDRDVAIKVLPASVAQDPERLARFEREAKTLASLNHPNIAQIYGVEDTGPAPCLVMELVEGEDLAAQIARGPMPLADVLPIARQIADALEASHDLGIIHRDLKPANIKVRPDGTVKVLDFGLAKAMDSSASGVFSDASTQMNSPAMTGMGVILGTAAYMAPEQAKGRAVDRRADIWAFGCVLYEMLTGTRVFQGEDVSETLASVLRADVDWSALPTDVPPPVVDLLRRCLERDLRQRLQAIGEARILLGRASGESASSIMARSNASALAPVPARGRSWMWLAVGALAGALAAIVGMQPWRAQAGPTAVRRFLIATDVAPDNIALSPDGRRVLFAANNKLLVREIDALQPREIPGVTITGGTDPAAPAWSPDGQSIVYGGEGKIWRVNAAGGAPSVICDLPGVYRGAAWKPDGTILISVTRGPMYQVSANGGEPRVLIPLDGKDDVDFHDPFVLPDGQSLLYSVHRRQGVDTIEALSGGQRKVLMRLEGRALEGPQVLNTPVYAPSGHLLYRLEQGNAGVWAVPFSLSTLTTAGEPFLVAAGGTRPTVATDGTLAYVAAGTGGPRQLAWFRPDGTLERTAGEPRKLLRKPWLSPDGRRVVFLADELNTDVWVSNVDGSGATRITFTPGNEEDPSWIPGQNAVAFTCPKAGGGAICSKNADGSGDVKVIAEQAGDAVFTSDGNAVLYSTSGQARRGLLSLDLRTPGAQPKEFAMGAEQLYPIGIVGGNKFGIFWGFSSGRPNATVKPFPAGDAKWELGSPVDDFPKLLPGGTALGWLQPRPDGTFALIGVPFETSPSVTAGQPRELFKNLPSTLEPDGSFDVSADGKHLLAVIKKSTGPAQRGIVVVLDWASEFRKK